MNKTYAPNEPPMIWDVEIGLPIFWKNGMRWVIPTSVSSAIGQVVCEGGWYGVREFTYNPAMKSRKRK